MNQIYLDTARLLTQVAPLVLNATPTSAPQISGTVQPNRTIQKR